MIDFDKQLANALRPIEFRLNEKDYTVESVTPEVFDEVVSIGESIEDGASIGDVHSRQLAILTGADESDFHGLDVRVSMAVISRLMDELTKTHGRRRARKKR